MPFLKDAGMQARLLIALPLLILIKPAIDNKVIAVAKYLSGALMSGKIFSQLHCEEQGDGRIQH